MRWGLGAPPSQEPHAWPTRHMAGGGLAAFVDENIHNWSYLCWKATAGPISCIAISSAWEPPKPPDGRTMGRALGKRGVEKIQERIVEIALPTRNSLVDDGVRVWIRAMKGTGEIVGESGAKLWDRSPV